MGKQFVAQAVLACTTNIYIYIYIYIYMGFSRLYIQRPCSHLHNGTSDWNSLVILHKDFYISCCFGCLLLILKLGLLWFCIYFLICCELCFVDLVNSFMCSSFFKLWFHSVFAMCLMLSCRHRVFVVCSVLLVVRFLGGLV